MVIRHIPKGDKLCDSCVAGRAVATFVATLDSGKRLFLCTTHRNALLTAERLRVQREKAIVNRRHTL